MYKMGKTLEEIKKSFDEMYEKVEKGTNYLRTLFTQGVTVKHPLRNGEEVTFKDSDEARTFFQELQTTKPDSPKFPLTEMGRPGNDDSHMRIFLYSKGVKPDEIVELMMNPDSEKSKDLAKKIEDYRQEYFDQVINRDTEKIAKMYVDACKNLQDYGMEWLRQCNTLEKCVENYPMLTVFGGSMSCLYQTLNLGTTHREVDIELLDSIARQSKDSGLNFLAFQDAMLYPTNFLQKLNSTFHSKKDVYKMAENTSSLAAMVQFNGSIPEGSTIGTLGGSGDSSINDSFAKQTDVVSYIYPKVIGNTETDRNINAFLEGQEGAVPPWQIFQTIDIKKQMGRMDWGLLANDNAHTTPNENDPENWKRAMEIQFREGGLMDPTSVIHCINLAKDQKYDQISGNVGDGDRMLQVMNGDYSQYDKLSDLSKAAVSGRLIMEHPELFKGTLLQMRKAAEEMGLDFGNPVYASAMDGVKKYLGGQHSERIAELKASCAADKLDTALKEAPIESRKSLAKVLFMMQLGDKDVIYGENLRRKNASMLETLAQGGEVRFVLPKMDEQQKSALEGAMPVGNTTLPNGVTQGVTYGSDNAMNVRVEGAIGRSTPQEGMEVDLRGMSASSLNACLKGLDEKISSMDPRELDEMIGKLKGGSLEKSELTEMIRSFGKDAMGQEKQDMPTFSLAAKEANPPLAMDQNDFNAFDRAYSMELDGERKYKGPDPLPTEKFEQALAVDTKPGRKEYFSKFLDHYKEQVRQMEMYADAAERMHRIRMENEMNEEPLNNVRVFSQNKEKELSEKYFAAKESVERMQEGIKAYGGKTPSERYMSSAWREHYFSQPDLVEEVNANAGMKGPSKNDLEHTMLSNFTALDTEAYTFRDQERLANNRWTFLGVKYKNSGRYNDILNSMDKLKDMRGNAVNAQSMEQYKKEYSHLQDLCEDYIVSHKNPWTRAGKERLRMVKETWEGMSNVKAENFDYAMKGAREGQKLGNLYVHSGERRKVSLQELMARDSERRERLNTARAERKAAMLREREAMRHGRQNIAAM